MKYNKILKCCPIRQSLRPAKLNPSRNGPGKT
jgi:hypothetical protein